jgi:4-hydroxythreonine-4-phosphate dehydrogenase
MGDPAGIGPELCLRTLVNPEILRLCDPVVFGRLEILERVGGLIGLPLPANLRIWEQLSKDNLRGPSVVNCPAPNAGEILPGKVSANCGKAAFGFIKTAIEAARAGLVDAVATAPIHKEALRLAGVSHSGHTEIFTALTGARRSCMMLWSEVLTVSMVTTHIGYAEVPARLSVPRIVDVIELTASALARMNGLHPQLAICGLNPHAGEQGLFGDREEEKFVEPAVQEARTRGISVEGPLPPDTAFMANRRKRFHGVVCLYHDQGHIPFKMLAFDEGVNITLGLPMVRTSVDHGTAFEIAWQGSARPNSLFKAVECAVRLSASGPQPSQPL